MLDLLTKLLEQLNASVFVLLLILLLAGYALHMLGRWTEKFLHFDQKLGEAQFF